MKRIVGVWLVVMGAVLPQMAVASGAWGTGAAGIAAGKHRAGAFLHAGLLNVGLEPYINFYDKLDVDFPVTEASARSFGMRAAVRIPLGGAPMTPIATLGVERSTTKMIWTDVDGVTHAGRTHDTDLVYGVRMSFPATRSLSAEIGVESGGVADTQVSFGLVLGY